MQKPALHRKTLWIVLALLALAALAWLAMRKPAQLASTATVTTGPLEAGFQEEGKTRLKQRYVITAPVAGTLRRITLQPGDAVSAGQVLAEIDPATSSLLDPRTRSQAQADIHSAQAMLAAARQRVSAAQTAQRHAHSDLQRAQTLHPTGAVATQELEQARTRAESARADLAAAQAEHRSATERLAAARAVLADEGSSPTGSPAESNSARNGKGSGKVLAIHSPVAGRILKRPLESATPIAAGQVLMEVGDPAQLEIEVEVLSTDAVQLRPGMTARVLRWGGEPTLQARIARVEPGGFTKVSALGVEEQRTRVVLDLTSAREQWATLGDAYRVEVDFITHSASRALQVPGSALFRTQDGWAVYRLENGKATRTPVTIGMRSASAVEIKTGLQQGQTVIVQPDERIEEGTRIQSNGS